MEEARDRREKGTEDAVYIPKDVELGLSVDAEMAARAAECEVAGHRWAVPEARNLCLRCGAAWGDGA
jgi:hypothetical protein